MLAGLSEFHASPGAAKAKPDAAAAQPGEKGDLCLQDGLCRAHYTRARGLSKANDYQGALTAYEAAYHRRAVPWLLLNIGRTLHKLGKPVEALGYYRRYQQEDQAPVPQRQQLLKEYTEQAEADVALQQQAPAAPTLAERPGAPAPMGATGETPVGSGDASSAEPAPADLVAEPTAKVGSMPLAVADAAPGGASAARPPSMSRTGLWVGLGVTGGFLLAGTALAITAQVSSGQLQNTTYVGAMPTADILALQERTRNTAISADVLFGVSALSLGVTLLATLVPRPARARPAEPGPVAAPSEPGAATARPAQSKLQRPSESGQPAAAKAAKAPLVPAPSPLPAAEEGTASVVAPARPSNQPSVGSLPAAASP